MLCVKPFYTYSLPYRVVYPLQYLVDTETRMHFFALQRFLTSIVLAGKPQITTNSEPIKEETLLGSMIHVHENNF